LVVALRQEHANAVLTARSYAGDLTLEIERDAIVEVCKSLRERHGFKYIIDICGCDFPKLEPRFRVVYHVYNHQEERRLRLKVATDEATAVPSITPVFRGANWPERETYDMYGVRFSGHPDLTRILLWEGFNGHPLRKDFPIEGIDTGAAIYPEYYHPEQGPVAGTGTGWRPPKPATETAAAGAAAAEAAPAKGNGEGPAS
jgi:NADH-quinone oxidoreductase subunit C